jgi:DNA-binding transcriptional ArsR family regulator
VLMEDILWYLLASSRGGETRARLLRQLADQPRNANQLAEDLDLDYTTVRHHLDVLMEDNVVKRTGDGYGDIYLLTDQVTHNWDTVAEILDTVDPEEQ